LRGLGSRFADYFWGADRASFVSIFVGVGQQNLALVLSGISVYVDDGSNNASDAAMEMAEPTWLMLSSRHVLIYFYRDRAKVAEHLRLIHPS
jgi:hypothetical protein